MSEQKPTSITEHFSELPDPRRGPVHKLSDVLTIAICGMISGANDWVSIAQYGRAKQAWFEKYLVLRRGIPSDDTFRRVFEALDSKAFERCFAAWVKSISTHLIGLVINIDGKALRRSRGQGSGQAMIHMVSAWAGKNHLVLGQEKVSAKSNEIRAIPKLLELLAIEGSVVTMDAMGCQREIAELITNRSADYVLALKGNQGATHDAVKLVFEHSKQTDFKHVESAYHRTFEKGHGRFEEREYWTIGNVSAIAEITGQPSWPGLKSMGMVRCRRTVGEKTTEETRYYLSSMPSDAEAFSIAVRGHWGIENGLHWVLDIAFREDESRVRSRNGAENLAVLRRIALNLLKQDKTQKCGIATKRLRAGWDQDFLLAVLAISKGT